MIVHSSKMSVGFGRVKSMGRQLSVMAIQNLVSLMLDLNKTI